jgi:ribosomal protein S18 acetylase RimI-like enzyme
MTPCYRLRPATEADFEALFEVHVAALRPYVEGLWGWDEALQRELLTDRFDPSRDRVIVIDGAVVGHLVVDVHPHEVFLARIALLPDWQGRGIGTRIVGDVVRQAAAAEKPTRLTVLRTNERARALYERLGFRVTGDDEYRHYLRLDPSS